nr:putative Gag-polypeptide of LTR copia-type [Tanacetum cinerariifolium]
AINPSGALIISHKIRITSGDIIVKIINLFSNILLLASQSIPTVYGPIFNNTFKGLHFVLERDDGIVAELRIITGPEIFNAGMEMFILKPRVKNFEWGAKKEWGLSPKAKVRVLHTAQLDVTCQWFWSHHLSVKHYKSLIESQATIAGDAGGSGLELATQLANLLQQNDNLQPSNPKLYDNLQISIKLNSQNYALWTRMIRVAIGGAWGEIDRIDPDPMKCKEDIQTYTKIRSEQKLFQFLNGLDQKFEPIKREILRVDPLPTVEAAYAMDRKEAAHQIILGVINETHGIATGLIAGETDEGGFGRVVAAVGEEGEESFSDIRTGWIIRRVTERDGLYYVDEVVQSGTVMLAHETTEREAWLWHRRLGHPSVKNKRENDKIGTKPNKNGKRDEARKSQEQSQ